VLVCVNSLGQLVGESGPECVGVVGDGWVADDRAAGEQPGRLLGKFGGVLGEEAAGWLRTRTEMKGPLA
jgi:hypothetical protein